MGDVVELRNITRLDLPPDRILESAKGKLSEVIVIGFTEDGEEYFASSVADGGSVLWQLERAKKRLLDVSDREIPAA